MKSKDLKSLNESINSVVSPVQQHDVARGYINSLTGKARQLNEEKDEKEETPAQEKAEDKAEMLMKRLAAKALKRAKKKAATNEQTEKASSINQPIKRNPLAKPKIKKPPHDSPKPSGHYVKEEETHLAEKAAPGYENWASDPKVKASFKKQYGKDWKQVMYGRSWNMKKMDEETEQLDELSNQLLHRAKYASWVKRKLSKKTGEALDKKINRELLRRGDVHADRPRERRRSRSSEDWMSEDVQLNELSDALKSRAASKAYDSLRHSVTASHGSGSNREQAAKTAKKRLRQVKRFTGKKTAMPSPDLVVVSEAGYKRLGRIKGAAYKAELASRGADPNTSLQGLVKAAKLKRAAAEREAQVAAGMARRGGASPDAVRGGGSRIGPSGKYTQKAGALANQRDKALAKFRMKARTAQLFDKGEDQSRKRERQQAQAAFEKKARTGDFGQDNQAALRARSNFQKRFGRLKGK